MADIRCPMCGRPNPADRDVCQFCQARLKPLVIPPASGEEKPAKPEDSPVPEKPLSPDSSLPDWLRDLRQKDKEEAESVSQEPLPDWFSEEVESPSSSEEAGSEEPSDWLRGLIQKDEQETKPGQEAPAPDWLSEVSGETSTPEESNLLDASDWWSRISREEESREQTPPTESASELRSISEPAASPPGETTEGGEGALPDWLATLNSDEFLGIGTQKGSEEGVQPPSPAAPAAEEEGEEPEWLRRVRERQKSGDQPPVQAFLSEEGEEPPAEHRNISPGSTARPNQESDLPDWLSNLAQEPASEEVSPGLTDWLEQQRAAGPEPGTPAPEEALPDWLSRLNAQDQGTSRWDETGEPEQQGSIPAPEETGLPDWLTKLETGAQERGPESSVPAFVFDEENEPPVDLGEAAEKPGQGIEKEEEAVSPYLSTLPEWISQVSKEGESGEKTPAEEEEPGLAPAQLPNWLEAMRPVEAAAPAAPVGDDLTTQVEKVGPLAGLRGVIPAEPIIGHLRKPPVYSVKLQVSGTQQRNTVLLQKLLESEAEAKPIRQAAPFASQAVLRLIIAVALILAVLVPLWLNSQRLPLPDPNYVPAGLIQTIEQIGKINSGDPVLVAIDYEPGLSAEMDAGASAIVDKIASRGGSMALVSTNPVGPLLAERLMSQINGKRGQNQIQYANLGFIAGGPAGLASFAGAPGETIPFNLRNSTQPPRANLWEIGPLAKVHSAADFAVVVVITEDPDTARDWIEQVQPLLGQKNVPLLMIVSAQSEPMVRPYFEGTPQQVNGLVAGLNGLAAFERQTQQPGLARSYWDAFGSGLLVAEALILVGGLINVALALLLPRKGNEAEGKR